MRATRVVTHATAIFIALAALVCSGAPSAVAQSTQSADTPSGKVDFELGVPTPGDRQNPRRPDGSPPPLILRAAGQDIKMFGRR